MSKLRIDYGRWRSLQGYGAFAQGSGNQNSPLFVQFSGGRTSGFMACMAPDDAVITYQNTGREHEKTLEFIRNVGDALDREIVWLEFRPPKRKGAPPREFGWERVTFDTAARKGEPLIEFMRSINEYRHECGNPPVAPWARSRLCTVHVKHRVLDHYLRDSGIEDHTRWIGLRADEPIRVAKLFAQETLTRRLAAPLYVAGIDKGQIVDEFWPRQPFDLGIEEYEGNCDGCFLKDQADVSRAIGNRPEAIEFWGGMQDVYPRFGGETFYGYRELAAELPARLSIERALCEGRDPKNDHGTDAKRFRLLVIQENKRLKHGSASFSCSCEASMDPEPESDMVPRQTSFSWDAGKGEPVYP